METKRIILSSYGIQNIILDNSLNGNEIQLLFDQVSIKMNHVLAEFISPIVSRIRRSDPTIESIQFRELYLDKTDIFDQFSKEIFTEEMISLIKQISNGIPTNINAEQAYKMRFISIILGNEELFEKINEIFSPDIDESNLDLYLNYFQISYQLSQLTSYFDFSILVDQIAKNFFLIDQEKLLKLPKRFQYEIISNSNIKIENEDSLFEFVQKIISNDTNKSEEEEFDDYLFYEQIEFCNLSDKNLHEFIENLDPSQITNGLWSKLSPCFFSNKKTQQNRYSNKKMTFNYDENRKNRFDGIFNYLNNECNGNCVSRGLIDITLSSKHINCRNPVSNVVDFNDKRCHIATAGISNEWVKFNFKDKKVQPNYYSIRTWHNGPGNSHLKSWVIEGSNTDNNDDWKILDSRNDITSLDSSSAEVTFKITTQLKVNESFQYLRIRQTGLNSRGTTIIFLSAVEFFGNLSYV